MTSKTNLISKIKINNVAIIICRISTFSNAPSDTIDILIFLLLMFDIIKSLLLSGWK